MNIPELIVKTPYDSKETKIKVIDTGTKKCIFRIIVPVSRTI